MVHVLQSPAAHAKDPPTPACLAVCGALIAGSNTHPICVVCMDSGHAEEAVVQLDNCVHCHSLPRRLLCHCLKVAASLVYDAEPLDSDSKYSISCAEQFQSAFEDASPYPMCLYLSPMNWSRTTNLSPCLVRTRRKLCPPTHTT